VHILYPPSQGEEINIGPLQEELVQYQDLSNSAPRRTAPVRPTVWTPNTYRISKQMSNWY